MDEKITINSKGKPFDILPEKKAPVEDKRLKAIESTAHLLDNENVAYIIYIDDKFDINGQKEEYIARLNNLKAEGNYITSDRFNTIDWTGPAPRFEKLISQLWETSDNKSELLYEVCTHIKDDDSANVIPALEIEKCYGDRIKLMTPDEWLKDNYQEIKALEEGQRVICLFDFEFQTGNTLLPGKNGAQLAKSLIDEKTCSDKVVCGIFSHKFAEDQEDEFREKYSIEYDVDKSKFYTISKRRFAFDPQITGFAEGIKNLLLLPYIEQLKTESLIVLEESNKKAGERINDITPNTFNHIIQKSSLKEGVWEISTLFRLYGILSKEENYNMISDSTLRLKFNNSINRIREIDSKDTGYKSTFPNHQLIELRNSELYLSGEIINKLHLPLTNGDIFEIKKKEYILLVQPCNLALRAYKEECGKRDYEYDTGILIPLKFITEDRLNINMEEVKQGQINDKVLVSYFPGFKTISLNILDLVVFNESGSSSIDLNTTSLDNDVIHFPWKKRYEYIHKDFLNYENKLHQFDALKEGYNLLLTNKQAALKSLKEGNGDKREIKALSKEIGVLKKNFSDSFNNIMNIEDLKKFKIDCSKIYDETNRILNLQIKRKRHYKNPHSDDLLQKFMQYLSRNAFEHDFTSS
ncbi:hypothetical protein U8527_10565 [Kordia algicida OT-1]|uniref:Uncharacterized protein n=1 Tax=Kordia algicida OT-1 TaxID=391587 RepID=A9DWE9_9FLAO|nr:hypothetical protein [Kordia algicida]EDP96550.1 hypothetical protein KAOT1_04037 [Kordia algicida OT-1]